MYLCVQKASSQHSSTLTVLQIQLSAFDCISNMILQSLLTYAVHLFLITSCHLPLLWHQRDPWSGQGCHREEMNFYCSLLASTPLPAAFLALWYLPPGIPQPASTFGGVICWEVLLCECSLQVLSPSPQTEIPALVPQPKRETCLAPSGEPAVHPWERRSLFCCGLGGAAPCSLIPDAHTALTPHPFPLPPGVMQRVIKMAGCDSRNITTFSHFNLIWSSQAFHAHSIETSCFRGFSHCSCPASLPPHPPPHLFLYLLYLFTVKRKGIYCFIHIKWLSCNRNKLLVRI